jgi:hypothetical protein
MRRGIILFEGRQFVERRVGEVWREGRELFSNYSGQVVRFKFENEGLAEIGREFLLRRLGRT